jgi:hypothetical protein
LIDFHSSRSTDQIALRLSEFLNPAQLLRLYSYNHLQNAIPPALAPYASYHDSATRYMPPRDTLVQFQVIAATSYAACLCLRRFFTSFVFLFFYSLTDFIFFFDLFFFFFFFFVRLSFSFFICDSVR